MLAVVMLATAPLLLEVPFVAQRQDGCATAALAMVLRYWGDPAPEAGLAGALPADSARGVAGSRLAELARARGYRAIAYAGDLSQLRDYLGKGRPLIVAHKTGSSRYHDVVVIGVDDAAQEVVVHDPAIGPGRRISFRSFEERWRGAGHWTLLVLPSTP